MKTNPRNLTSLLELGAVDSQLAQLKARYAELAANEELKAAVAKRTAAREHAQKLLTFSKESRGELRELEDRGEKLGTHVKEVEETMMAGGLSSKELVQMQSENDAAKAKLLMLENQSIELMLKVEEAELKEKNFQQTLEEITAAAQELVLARDAEASSIRERAEELKNQRKNIELGIDDPKLLDLYTMEHLRNRGAAVAKVLGSRCGACNYAVHPGDKSCDLNSEPDQVLRCPECSAILVREEILGNQ